MSLCDLTVFLVDDNLASRNLCISLLQSVERTIEVFESAFDFVKHCDYSRYGCLVLNIQVPDLNCREMQTFLVNNRIEFPVVFLAGSDEVPAVVAALSADAAGFLQRPLDGPQLLAAVDESLRRSRHRLAEEQQSREEMLLLATLTPREREVMQLLCEGKSGKTIAQLLDISYKTLEKFRHSVMRKMQVSSLAELVIAGVRLKVIKTMYRVLEAD